MIDCVLAPERPQGLSREELDRLKDMIRIVAPSYALFTDVHYQWRKKESVYVPKLYFNDKIRRGMRRILVGWMSEVAVEYELEQKTLFLAVNLVDRYLSQRLVERSRLQLVGCSCLMLASKFEQVDPPIASDFAYISDNTYSTLDVIQMEKIVFHQLQSLASITVQTFLPVYAVVAELSRKEDHLAQFIAEVTMMDPNFFSFRPSLIAAAIVYYVRLVSGVEGEVWTGMLKYLTKYDTHDLIRVGKVISTALEKAFATPEGESAIRLKFAACAYVEDMIPQL